MPLVRFFSAALEFALEIAAGLFRRLVVIAIVGVILFYLLELWIGNVPPLISGLSGTLLRRPLPNQAQVFDERVHAAFPEGTHEAEMVGALVEQGFEIRPAVEDGKLIKRASYSTGDILCRTSWRVYWRTDETGRIAKTWTNQYAACL